MTTLDWSFSDARTPLGEDSPSHAAAASARDSALGKDEMSAQESDVIEDA